MPELNPDHPVTKAARNQWHSIVALMMHKLKITEITFTQKDMDDFPEDLAVALGDHGDHCKVALIPLSEAEEIIKKQEKKS